MEQTTAVTHSSMNALNAQLDFVRQSPRNGGRVEMIVVRPVSGERAVLKTGQLSEKGGLHGDRWADGCWKSLPDGSPDPIAQITIMNSRLAQLVANDKVRWPLAGDQLYADLDLSYENLPVGQRLGVGTAVLEITEELHKGCAKFRARFGDDALKFISNEEGRRLNLRGIYAKVVQAGEVSVGDVIRKIRD
jgi:hypothetical protein